MAFANLGYERRLQALERFMREIRGDHGAISIAAWTPFFFGDGGTGGTFTYTAQTGRYTTIGGYCFIQGVVAISAIAVAPTGSMRIAGIPFTAANVANTNGGISFSFIHNFNYAANAVQLTGVAISNENTISLYEAFDNGAAVAAPAANFTNTGCNIQFVGFYQIAGA